MNSTSRLGKKNGYEIHVSSFMDAELWKVVYTKVIDLKNFLEFAGAI